MTVTINIEEYELLMSFKDQFEEKKQEYFKLLKEKEVVEIELRETVNFHRNERNKSLLQLSIIEGEISKSRQVLDELKKQSRKESKAIVELEKKVCANEKMLTEQSLKN